MEAAVRAIERNNMKKEIEKLNKAEPSSSPLPVITKMKRTTGSPGLRAAILSMSGTIRRGSYGPGSPPRREGTPIWGLNWIVKNATGTSRRTSDEKIDKASDETGLGGGHFRGWISDSDRKALASRRHKRACRTGSLDEGSGTRRRLEKVVRVRSR